MFHLNKFHPMLKAGASAGETNTLAGAISATGVSAHMILDAADAASYPGSGQSWLDRSGNGYDFFLGADGSATATDPTFNGSAGGLSSSEYFSFDGGDYFTYDTTNEAWMENLHKDGAAFSIIMAIWIPNLGAGQSVFATNDLTTVGVAFRLNSGRTPRIQVQRSGGSALGVSGDTAMSSSAWHIIGLSLDENGGSVSFFYLDGAYNQVSAANTFNAAYSSPAATSAGSTAIIGAHGSGSSPLPNTSRLGFFAIGTTAWSKANFDTIYGYLKGRYGLS